MIDIFYALSTIYIAHRVFTFIKPDSNNIFYFMVEATYVLWVFLGLFSPLWYMFLFLIICGQLGLVADMFIKYMYMKNIIRILSLVDILLLFIINLLSL